MNDRASTEGFSVLEIILASAIFVMFATSIATMVLSSLQLNQTGSELTIANQYASEGIEVMHSLKNKSFASLTNTGSTGVAFSGGIWTLSGASNTFDKYTRVISIADAQRDGGGNIVSSGGTIDPLTKKITSTVNWNVTSARANSVVFSTYMSDWKAPFGKGAVLVYGDGGTTSDAIKYQILDGSGTWSAAAATADVDSVTTNRALRVARVYASSTRNEKIMISRHFNGTAQYIYAQVFNGTTWGSVQLLSTWNTNSFLDVHNFDGTYLNSGTFMAVYSDNTNTPKMRTWNGSSWSSAVSMSAVGGAPDLIVSEARPGTNEVMVSILDQNQNTTTQYFNGGSFTTASWSTATNHATKAADKTKRQVDFEWSPNNATKGALVFSNSNNDKAVHIKIWTANGSGSGSWSGTSSIVQADEIGSVAVKGRKGANEFFVCNKDSNTPPAVLCYRSDFTPVLVGGPPGSIVTATTEGGSERSFHIGFERQTSTTAITVYSDATNIPKLKKYDAATSTLDPIGTPVTISPLTLGTIAGVIVATDENGDDMMAVLSDANNDLYTVGWDGTNNVLYSTGGKAFTVHGTNGPTSTAFWFDFAFDKF